MTKLVRLENADTSDYKIVVEVWDKFSDGRPDMMVNKIDLDFPTSLGEIHITSTRYLVVKEK